MQFSKAVNNCNEGWFSILSSNCCALNFFLLYLFLWLLLMDLYCALGFLCSGVLCTDFHNMIGMYVRIGNEPLAVQVTTFLVLGHAHWSFNSPITVTHLDHLKKKL